MEVEGQRSRTSYRVTPLYQRHTSIQPAASEAAPFGRTTRLLDEARALVEQAERDARERHAEVSRRTSHLEECLREMEELLVRTERQAAQLANLYVATYQLHASLAAPDVRAAVADIAVNLLGAERFSILDPRRCGSARTGSRVERRRRRAGAG